MGLLPGLWSELRRRPTPTLQELGVIKAYLRAIRQLDPATQQESQRWAEEHFACLEDKERLQTPRPTFGRPGSMDCTSPPSARSARALTGALNPQPPRLSLGLWDPSCAPRAAQYTPWAPTRDGHYRGPRLGVGAGGGGG